MAVFLILLEEITFKGADTSHPEVSPWPEMTQNKEIGQEKMKLYDLSSRNLRPPATFT